MGVITLIISIIILENYTGNHSLIHFVGLELTFPIFQGFKRIHQVRSAQLQIDRVDWEIVGLKDSITSEYAQAIGFV